MINFLLMFTLVKCFQVLCQLHHTCNIGKKRKEKENEQEKGKEKQLLHQWSIFFFKIYCGTCFDYVIFKVGTGVLH